MFPSLALGPGAQLQKPAPDPRGTAPCLLTAEQMPWTVSYNHTLVSALLPFYVFWYFSA